MYLSTALAVGGVLAFCVGAWSTYRLMPKLRAREQRGDFATPVPDPGETQAGGVRLMAFVWKMRTSADRPRFRRHVMLVRWAPVVGAGLMLASLAAVQTERRPAGADDPDAPPPVMLSIGADPEPVAG